MIKNYKVVNDQWVELTDAPYEGIVIQYGRVQFQPNEHDDKLTISFKYDIIDGEVPGSKTDFEQYIGAILHELIEEQLGRNDVVYTGGVDES